MRQMISFSLSRFRGAKILEASDGVDAMKKLAENSVDLVLTDINMPVMDGLKLVGLLRQDPKTRNLPIVIITTEGAEADRERGMALGATAYIVKPIQPSELLKTINGILGA